MSSPSLSFCTSSSSFSSPPLTGQMEMMMGDSRQSVATLQTQLDEYRERSRKDLLDAQRNSKDRLAELQRAQSNLKAQQEEVRERQLKIKKGKFDAGLCHLRNTQNLCSIQNIYAVGLF